VRLYDDVVLPALGEQHDWELELAAVIGRRTHHVDVADALDHTRCLLHYISTRLRKMLDTRRAEGRADDVALR
jgi:2-keto-4-pentenoate hydratase/2-oxohepta-3-ene-1,7-dioic acid hydratase in catechol pathway